MVEFQPRGRKHLMFLGGVMFLPPRPNHKATFLATRVVLLFTSVLPSIFPNLESMVVQSSWGSCPSENILIMLGRLW